MKTPAVTQKTLASALGVHQTTVSQALAGSPKVAPELRARVEEAAQRLGYRRDPLLRALTLARLRRPKTRFAATLAMIGDYEREVEWRWRHPILRGYRAGVRERAAEHGFGLDELCFEGPRLTGKRIEEILDARGIRAVVVGTRRSYGGRLEGLAWERLTAVTLGYTLVSPVLDRVTTHHMESVMVVVRELAKRGYRRPGLVLRPEDDERVLGAWRAGFLAETGRLFSEAGRCFVPARDEDFNPVELGSWLRRERVDGVVGASTQVRDWMRELGWRIPEEMGFADLGCDSADGPNSGIFQDPRAVGAAAVDVLVAAYHERRCGLPSQVRTTLLSGRWVAGQTLRSA